MGRLFGTDGIRGVANEKLTVELAVATGRAVAASIGMAKGKSNAKKTILLGMDTRISSDMLASALTAGILSVGYDVINLGVVPTPAVAYLTRRYKAHAGIMISASHNPFEFNGIKVFNADGFKLADELEENIESMVLGEVPMPKPATGAKIGKIIHKPEAIDDYIKFVALTTTERLDGLTVAFDCANGSSSRTAEKLFTSLGVKCVMLSDKPDGTNINAACGSTHLENLIACVKEKKLDIGIAFDGDADRVLCVDGNGEVVDGDMIMAILALDMKARDRLKNNTVVGTIMTNLGFIRFCEANDIRFAATKVGDRYVLEEMLSGGYNIGGEQSGHIIFLDEATTGDGELSGIKLLEILKKSSKKMSELAGLMECFPQVLYNVTIQPQKKGLWQDDADIAAVIEKHTAILGDNGRILVRESGTEPLIRVMVEGKNAGQIEAAAQEITEQVKIFAAS